MGYRERARPRGGVGWSAVVLGLAIPTGAMAQADPGEQAPPAEVTVTGKRIPGSVIGAVEPVAVLDTEAIAALGAPSLAELLKRVKSLTSSASGGEPVMLLNGRRV